MRLDLYLFANGYVKSRQKAKTLIENGGVKIDGKIIKKPSYEVSDSETISVEIEDSCPYVSRGGLKIEAIIKEANITVNDKVCLDIGASTGGFTDCLLKHGAKRVYAVDSGTNQLDLTLKENKNVISIENYNARNINIEDIGEAVDIITIDVSFISQALILPSAVKLLNENGIYISLIKPQFEVGKENIGKGGIVKDKKARLNAVNKIIECARINELKCTSFIKSPIQGGDGNTEYLAVFCKNEKEISEDIIETIILRD